MHFSRFHRRLWSVLLAMVMVFSAVVPAMAAEDHSESGQADTLFWEKIDNSAFSAPSPFREELAAEDLTQSYADTDEVRVAIVLEDASTLEEGFTSDQVAACNAGAMDYRASLEEKQVEMEDAISEQVLHGDALDVVWNLTLAANMISANVTYGQIAQIAALPGVKEVLIENRYDPCVLDQQEVTDPLMSTSGEMIGSDIAWAEGYTGAGTRIAVIDSGLDVDHPSLDPDALLYALKDSNATLMSASDISPVLEQLNAFQRLENVTADDLYINAKIPFGFNYIDRDLDVTHDNDTQGDHGSHVTGIAAGNRYIPNGDGTYSDALEAVLTQGVAPDAQILVMKVFGKAGGAYDTDYMVAIEDAILLGADSVNLSLGGSSAGYSYNTAAVFQSILETITESGTVVCMAAGNSGYWFEHTNAGYPYAGSVGWSTAGSPGSFTNSLDVASADNIGSTYRYLGIGSEKLAYRESTNYSNAPFYTISGDHSFVYVDSIGTPEEFAAVSDLLKGNIAVCNRGELSFAAKANAAVENGAIGVLIVNNEAGTIGMDLTEYTHTAPCAGLTLDCRDVLLANAQAVTDDDGNTLCYTGSIYVSEKPIATSTHSTDYKVSSFSSWGVPGSLELKPEITAPGGNIFSLENGGTYKNNSGTSMASPQVAGMAALVAEYIKANDLDKETGKSLRQLSQSLLMSTAQPLIDSSNGSYYPVLRQGAGLANVGEAIHAGSYLFMDADATDSYADGKIKAELGDDPDRTGTYTFGFTLYNRKDEASSFHLRADFFTQALLSKDQEDGSTVLYTDTATAPLASQVSWTVDGQNIEMADLSKLQNCDFDGSGTVGANDGQALLDFVTGARSSISCQEYADLDGNGSIGTYDAYLFFQALGTALVTVPAGGSIHVTVQAQVLGLDAYDAAGNGSGAFVEGYVFAEEMESPDGAVGTSHSIPVLGYYGSWTDASMFDMGSALDYHYGTETREPYLAAALQENAKGLQSMTIQYSDHSQSYDFGANPYVDDGFYDSDRYSFNPDTAKLMDVYFALIRNASASRITVTGDDGVTYLDKSYDYAIGSAFYQVANQFWTQYQSSLPMNISPKAAEDTQLTVTAYLAPEYYIDFSGEAPIVDWDALHDGAKQTYTLFVDKTEPTLSDVFLREDVASGERRLFATASDNRYVAAAILYDYDTNTVLSKIGGSPQGAARGEDVSLDMGSIDTEAVKHLVLQVYDYANNVSTYRINLNREELDAPVAVKLDQETAHLYKGGNLTLTAEVSPFGIHPDGVVWTSSDENVATVDQKGRVQAVNGGEAVITATAEADPSKSASCTVTVEVLKVTLHGALTDADRETRLFSWDLENDAQWTPGNTVAVDGLNAITYDSFNHQIVIMDSAAKNFHVVDEQTGAVLSSFDGIDGNGGFNVPLNDMEASRVFTEDGNPTILGVYSFFVFNPAPLGKITNNATYYIMDLMFGTGGSKFATVSSFGESSVDLDGDGVAETPSELYTMLDDRGGVWSFQLYQKDGAYNLKYTISHSNLPKLKLWFMGDDNGPHCSTVPTVEDGKLVMYLSYFTGKISQLYRMVYDASSDFWNADLLADFGTDVFPANIYAADYHGAAETVQDVAPENLPLCTQDAGTAALTDELLSAALPEEAPAAGSLSAYTAASEVPATAPAQSALSISEDEKTVTVTVVSDADTTNALMYLDFDPEVLEFRDIQVLGDYTSAHVQDGAVAFGYVSLGGLPAGTAVASVSFTLKDPAALGSELSVTLRQTERNESAVEFTKTLTAALHSETVVTGQKKATCTDSGYTGDILCAACGRQIQAGTVLPATGHHYGSDGKCVDCGALRTSAPNTGDSFDSVLWTLLLLGSGLMMSGLWIFFRKRTV